MKNKVVLTILTMITGLLAFIGLTSCGSSNPVEELKLTKNFEGKDFLSDGIQEAKLGSISDGDTAFFSGYNVRFYGINTPESTGQIEKWGKAASNFTKEKLKGAKSIVIEGTNGIGNKPSTEGTGGRYLAYVWYMPENSDRYFNLNVELVYNGFSDSTIMEGESDYYKYYEKANSYAIKNKLNIHSDEKDPLYDESLEVMDLKTISENPAAHDQEYVQVEAYIISSSSTSNEITIAQDINGKTYTFTIYLGYESFPNEIIRVGNLVKFVARVNSHYDKWQLSGLEYSLMDEKTSRVIVQGYRCTFGQSLDLNYGYEAINVQEVTTEGDFVIVKGTTKNLRVLEDVNVTVKIPSSAASNIKVGSKLSCVAYNTSKVSFAPDNLSISLEVLSSTDIK